MASNLTVSASVSNNRSADVRSSVSMGAEPAAQQFSKALEREVNNRQEGKSSDSGDKKSSQTTAAKDDSGEEEKAQSTAAGVQAAEPWLLMMQAQALTASAVVVPATALTTKTSALDTRQTGLDLGGSTKDGKDLTAGEPGLTPANLLAGDLDPAKLALLRQKTAGGGSESAAPEEDFAALLASSKETAVLPKAEAAPLLTRAPVSTEMKPVIPQHTVSEPVGNSRWGDAVAQRVSMMLRDQNQQIDMQLNPPHLGPMEVRLTMSGEQASVVFSSQHAAVREALAAATPRLTMLLADQGIQLSNVQVASDSLNQHAQQQAQQQTQQQASQQMNQRQQSGGRQFAGDMSDVYGDGQARILTDVHLPVARSGLNLYV